MEFSTKARNRDIKKSVIRCQFESCIRAPSLTHRNGSFEADMKLAVVLEDLELQG
jgi:hypothetical protein